MKLESLIDALELLVEERKINKSSTHRLYEFDELLNLVAEILDSIYQSAKINELEIKFRHAMTLDVTMLEKALNLIEKGNPKELKLKKHDHIVINPKNILGDLRKFISENKLSKKNAIIKIEWFYDSLFDKLLLIFNSNDPIFKKLQNLLSKKLEAFDEGAVLLLWAKIKDCFGNQEKKAAYEIYDDIFPEHFFSSSNKMNVRDKCAAVLVKYKPLTIRRMLEEGANSFPNVFPGVPKLLTLKNTSDISQITSIELLLVRSLSQIVAAYECIANKANADSNDHREYLAKMIGAYPYGFIFDGDFYNEYKNAFDKSTLENDPEKILLLNARRAIKYTSALSESQEKIESALRLYKMGQEIIHPARISEFKKLHRKLEVYLQKDISKFFLEHNILAYGKTIGRGAIDLYHKDITGQDFVIEVKVYKKQNLITKNNLTNNLIQLKSYMDQHEQPRGILALYNFTNTLMVSPRKWLNGRILIICINLCDDPPSKRKSSLEIIETEKWTIEIIHVKD